MQQRYKSDFFFGADCSTGGRTFDTRLSPASQWVNVDSFNLPLKVKRNPRSGKVDDIELRVRDGQQCLVSHPYMNIKHQFDKKNNLEYILHMNANGDAIAVCPVTKEYLKIIRNQRRSGNKLNPLIMKEIT